MFTKHTESVNAADVASVLTQLNERKANLKAEMDKVDSLIAQLGSWVTTAHYCVQLPLVLSTEDSHGDSGSVATVSRIPTQVNEESRESLTSRLIGILDATPDRTYSPMEMASALGVAADDVSARTSYLVKRRRIVKVSRGEYQSTKHSRKDQAEMALAG